MSRSYTLTLNRLPLELKRGLRLISACQNVKIRDFVVLTLYNALDSALSGRIDWRSSDGRSAAVRNLGDDVRAQVR